MAHLITLWLAQQSPSTLLWIGFLLGWLVGAGPALFALVRYAYRWLTNRCTCCGIPLDTPKVGP